MTKTYLKILLIALPLIGMAFLEALFFPRDQFTFRAWEAVKTNLFSDALPGPFYPSIDQEFMEAGDQDPRRQKKLKNRWKTDVYGQRNTRLPRDKEPFGVLVGDSNIDGSSLDQEQILSEELRRRTGMLWVNITHEYINPWEHPVCRKELPQIIVFQLKRGSLLSLQKLGGRVKDPLSSKHAGFLEKIDHGSKLCCLNKLRANLGLHPLVTKLQFREFHLRLILECIEKHYSCGFYIRKADSEKWAKSSPELILKGYADFFRQRGVQFIVVVLPDTTREADPIIQKCSENGISMIGFLPSSKYPSGADLNSFWQTEDSHWSVNGLLLMASEIMKLIPKTRWAPNARL